VREKRRIYVIFDKFTLKQDDVEKLEAKVKQLESLFIKNVEDEKNSVYLIKMHYNGNVMM
jgi:hypothetical protein